MLLQFDFTANVSVSRCFSGVALINVIIKECLFYFSEHLCFLSSRDPYYFKRKPLFEGGELTVLNWCRETWVNWCGASMDQAFSSSTQTGGDFVFLKLFNFQLL